mgnify:CR=1 FL=1
MKRRLAVLIIPGAAGRELTLWIPLVRVWIFEYGKAIEFRRVTDTAKLNWAFEA